MKTLLAAAQYPITAFNTLDEWQCHTGAWVAEAARQGARLLLFPEYGAMELSSLLKGEERSDLRRQIGGMARLLDAFLTTYATLARRHGLVIAAPSYPVVEGENVYNRAFVFSSGGLAGYQDKWFMTRFEDEEWGVQAGPSVLTLFEADWGMFGIQICYDVEFPLGTHGLCAHGAGLILAPSCTETLRGATRVHVGARARALENQCYVAVAQTVGEARWSPAVDVNFGYAAVYTTPDRDLPEEGILAKKEPQQVGWLLQEIDFQQIKSVRENGQVLNFRDQQRIGYQFGEAGIRVLRCRV